MKLGIVVVYLFADDRYLSMVDLHLSRIERHTEIPYVIYGGVNRLAPRFREYLSGYPQVNICEVPETDLRGAEEHAYYLDRLVEIAVADGATHIVTMHVDSFPVRSGWAEALADKLSESHVMATIERINTACLFFGRDFHLQHRPTLRLSEAECRSPEYSRYMERHNPIEHSGIGYGFAAYCEGRSWYSMQRTCGDETLQGMCANIFDDMIFHLGRGVFSAGPAAKGSMRGSGTYLRFMTAAAPVYRAALPLSLRLLLRACFSSFVGHMVDQPRILELERVKERLFFDGDGYLASLMEGRRTCGSEGA